MVIMLGTTTCILLSVTMLMLVMLIIDHVRSKKKQAANYRNEDLVLRDPPGPTPWPILGSLHILGQYDVPYKAFGHLRDTYNSNIVKIKLGSVSCIVVNGLENIREVLFGKGSHFDSRPNFSRFDAFFDGNRSNSLAFCDWSDVQKTRRELLKVHVFPSSYTAKYSQLNSIITTEVSTLIDFMSSTNGERTKIKTPLLQTCGNVFTNYFCSKRFDGTHEAFAEMINTYDKVFYEVNMGYLVDFVPSTMPFYTMKVREMKKWSTSIRKFMMENIVQNRLDNWNSNMSDEDYLDSIIRHFKSEAKPEIPWSTILLSLEDIVGGHSAIGNFMMKIFGYLVTRPHIQRIAQQEIDRVQSNSNIVGLEERKSIPYVEAIILECIRLICSPIVPHVANQNSSIADYRVQKDDLIFLNNYDLQMSDKLWTKPNEFIPERFIQNGHIVKPEHFLPFGGGVRSCMGYKLVQYVSFVFLASILKNFTILPAEGEVYKIPIGYLAIPIDTYSLRFEKR